jgi:hypothetical protein
MNMKRALTFSFTILLAFLISSCVTTYQNQKKIIGTWKAVKVEVVDVPVVPAATANAQSTAKSGTGETNVAKGSKTNPAAKTGEVNLSASKNDSARLEGLIARVVESEKKSTLTINADKTAVKEMPGKTVHSTWKFKNHGNSIIVNTKETSKKVKLDIIRITDTSAVVKSVFQVGTLKITYHKVK